MQTSAQTVLFVDPEPEYTIGIDESGTGAWAGSFFVTGVLARSDWKLDGVGDSKSITDDKRRALVPLIKGVTVSHTVEVAVGDVDRCGQKPMWRDAIQEILDVLEPQIPAGAVYRIIVDGGLDQRLARKLGMDDRSRPLGVDFVPKADKKHQHVGAASILAKTARNDAMLKLHEWDRRYGWDTNYGYITEMHAVAVEEYGTCIHHRKINAKLQRKQKRIAAEATRKGGAFISGAYRYKLWRRWRQGSHVTFVMLNPSTADATVNDPTVRKCIGFAKRWGYGAIEIVNLYALRSTDPGQLLIVNEPIGPSNDVHVALSASKAALVVCAWGGHKAAREGTRIAEVRQLLRAANVSSMCLGLTKTGQPRHPLMLAYKTPLEPLGTCCE